MNTQLETLFERYNFSAKNRYEINQFFWLLPDKWKQNILDNFEILAVKIYNIEKEINIERDILIWSEVNYIKSLIIEWRINKQKKESRKEIMDLNF